MPGLDSPRLPESPGIVGGSVAGLELLGFSGSPVSLASGSWRYCLVSSSPALSSASELSDSDSEDDSDSSRSSMGLAASRAAAICS